ncbi:MAG: hypothetical protein DI536_06035 [Archangium gephyra]|uniref:PatA-like N-terminal domain-containing protein n=1 Tax=Archangium gephyra TaxID=48 RepID=A0A2W5TTV0_9BACT|nr:MAG: hypothetical protein DI536_06035 [Archangium gephyra]
MHGLAGDFSTMPLKDLVVYLWNRQATGVLVLENRGVRKEVMLDAGHIYNASSNLPREYLGQYLINLGHLSEEQFHKAYATQKETKVFLGKILEMIGAVKTETLSDVLGTKFRETLLDAFNWVDGQFRFDADKKPTLPEGLRVQVPLIEVHKEADFRIQAWKLIREAFPSGSCTLELIEENLVEPPRPGSIDEKIFAGIAAGQTIDEMALKLHATDYFLYNRLYAYFHMGALTVHQPSGPELSIDVDLGLGDSPSAGQLLDNARAFYAKSNFRDSWALARRSNELTPTLDAALLMRQIEVAWGPQLKTNFVTSGRVPAMLMGPEQLAKLSLAAPERYLLSRVDGKRDVDNILRIAPLREFEALVAFDRFLNQKWIRLL